MFAKLFLKSTGMAALAASLSVIALPALAPAAAYAAPDGDPGDQPWRSGRDRREQGSEAVRPQAQMRPQGEWRGRGNAEQRQAPIAAPAPVVVQNSQPAPRAQGNWRGNDGAQINVAPERRIEPRADNRGDWNDRNRTARLPDRTDGNRWNDRNANRTESRNGSNSGWRNDNSGNWNSNDRLREARRGGGYDNDRRSYNGAYANRSGNDRHWDNGWRNNRRYDWSGYRSQNRNVYRLGGYYAPYRGYSYRRLGIGFFLDSLFFSNRYWIADPWQYRLPATYGPYRWVRYYDDVILVDIYSGEVVDVIHDFFW